MERVQFVQHKGRVILHINFAQCSAAEIFAAIEEAKAAIRTQIPGTVLTLTDVTGACFDSTISGAMKDLMLHNKPYVIASPIVGVTGMKQVIFNTVMRFSGRHLHAFGSLNEARDWLIRQ